MLKCEELLRLQDLVRGVPVADDVVRYAARLVAASRPGQPSLDGLHKYISYGASPRASQYLILGGNGRAILGGRYHVDFADVRWRTGLPSSAISVFRSCSPPSGLPLPGPTLKAICALRR